MFQKMASVSALPEEATDWTKYNNNNLIYIAPACRMTSEALAVAVIGEHGPL